MKQVVLKKPKPSPEKRVSLFKKNVSMCGMEYGMERNMFTILPLRTTFALQKMRNTTHPLPPFFVVIVVSFLITSLSYFLVFFFF